MFKGHNKGFTIIELLMVMGIIGVLIGVVVVNTRSSQAQARDDQRRADLSEIAAALELYEVEQGHYPLNNSSGNWSQWLNVIFPDYLNRNIEDPHHPESQYRYMTGLNDPNCVFGQGEAFVLEAVFETPEQVTLKPENFSQNPCETKFFVTGVYQQDGQYIYRFSGRQ